MPTFFPKIPVTFAISVLSFPAWLFSYWLGSARTYVLALGVVPKGTWFFLPLCPGLTPWANLFRPFGAGSLGSPYGFANDPRLTTHDYLCSLPKALISTSTPAGKSSFIKASTVCCVGSRMSSRRFCVRILNCYRDFLSTCGERSTQYLFFIVGRGIGPAICAPVRFAVSTISPVD